MTPLDTLRLYATFSPAERKVVDDFLRGQTKTRIPCPAAHTEKTLNTLRSLESIGIKIETQVLHMGLDGSRDEVPLNMILCKMEEVK